MVDGIRCAIVRGGSSKGAYFVADDLPSDAGTRDRLIMAVMGTPDPRQIDGIGGADPLTSKVAVVGPSASRHADIDYLFLQVGVDEPAVGDRQNCGNLLAGVGPFALERGLIARPDGTARVRIRMLNTDSVVTARFEVDAGRPVYSGSTAISGVPGTASAIQLDFEDLAGSTCGSMLPTTTVADAIDGVECTLIDNGMPTVVLAADSLDCDITRGCRELEDDVDLRVRLESIRVQAAELMGLGDVAEATIPKITIVGPPARGGTMCTRSFIPHRCHDAIGVFAAISVATASLLKGSPAHRVAQRRTDSGSTTVIEHPTGQLAVIVEATGCDDVSATPTRAAVVSTARMLMDGTVYPRAY